MTASGKSFPHRLLVYLCLNPLTSFIADWRLWLGAATATMVAIASQLSATIAPFVFGTLTAAIACAIALLYGHRPGVRAGAARAFSMASCLVPVQLLHHAVSDPSAALVDDFHIVLDGGWQLNPMRVVMIGVGNFLIGWAISSSPLPR